MKIPFFFKINDDLKLNLEYVVKNDYHLSRSHSAFTMRIYEGKDKRLLFDNNSYLLEFSYEN